jgi:hypothetical protein
MLLAFVEVAVSSQLRLPNASRALDYEERRLQLDEVASPSYGDIRRCLSLALARFDRSSRWGDTIAGDLIAITQTLVDRAIFVGAGDRSRLHRRIVAALRGYLNGVGSGADGQHPQR